MALVKCPECKSKVSDQAKSCPSCGMELNWSKFRENKEEIEKQKNNKIIKIALVFGALSLLGAIFSPPKVQKCDNLGAYAFLQTRGANYFKSPSTVKFASYTQANILSNDCQVYSIRTHADAQNSYGATVRSNVVAKIEKIDSGFKLITVNVGE